MTYIMTYLGASLSPGCQALFHRTTGTCTWIQLVNTNQISMQIVLSLSAITRVFRTPNGPRFLILQGPRREPTLGVIGCEINVLTTFGLLDGGDGQGLAPWHSAQFGKKLGLNVTVLGWR